jgi:LPS export ABC transporter protein LptC
VTRWLRSLRFGLGLFAIAFAVAVYFAIGERRPAPSPEETPARTDPNAVAETHGGVTLVAKGTREDFRVKYDRMLSYADGTAKFFVVEVEIPERAGRQFTLRGETASVTNNHSTVNLEGDVRLTASDGLEVQAQKATYDDTEGIVRLPGPVTFKRQHTSGRSVGATYDRGRDVLWLLEQAHITMAASGGGESADITAGSAGLARRERYMRFDRDVKLVRGAQVLEADNAMAYLRADDDRLEMLELRGNSRVRGAPSDGGLDSMSATDMNLAYGDDGQTLQRATLAGRGVVQMSGPGGAPGQRLSAESIDLHVGPDGATLTSLAAQGAVQLDLPADTGTPRRRIRSVSLEASGPAGQGITRARFSDHVEFRETQPATRATPVAERVARSRTLDAAVRPGFGALEAGTFGGGVTFSDGPLEATAPDAVYQVAKGTLQLAAPAGQRGAGARVSDDRTTVEARHIDVTLDGRGMIAEGDVRSVLKSSDRGTGQGTNGTEAGGTPRQVHRPALLRETEPVNVTAGHLVYDSATSQATYTGEARLWQGETAVHAPTLVLDDARGNLRASGGVRSTLRLDDTDETTGKTEKKTTVITAQDLVYEEAQRRATYTTDARMNGPEGDVRAATLELHLNARGDALERAEAYEQVTLRSGPRFSSGDRLTYFAADARYVLRGAPVKILEQLPAECRETTCRTLTLFRSVDTIACDGNDERRTETKSGGKCPGPPVP